MSTRLDQSKQGPKLVSVLSGAAWDALRHVNLETLAEASGVSQVFAALDLVFGDPKDVLLIEATDEALYLTVKQPHEEVVAFQARLESKFRRLEAAGELTIPSEVKGFVLAKQAGLSTAEVRELLTLTGGSLQYDSVKTSMRRLMWDFSKPSTTQKKGFGGSKPVFVTNELANNEGQESDEEHYDMNADEQWQDEILSEVEAQGVYMAYQEARQKLQAKKLGRGYFPGGPSSSGATKGGASSSGATKGSGKTKRRMDIASLKARSRCRSCGELGHWAKECPKKEKVHYTDGNAAPFPENSSYFVLDANTDDWQAESSSSGIAAVHFVAKGLSQVFRGLSLSSWSNSRLETCTPATVKQSSRCLYAEASGKTTCSRCHVSMSGENGQPESPCRERPLACIDTGCTRSLIGRVTLARLRHVLAGRGIKILHKSSKCTFRFGGDFSYVAQDVALIPCCVGENVCCISAYVVPGETPLLLSLPLLRDWGMKIDLQTSLATGSELADQFPSCLVQGSYSYRLVDST